MNGQQCCYDLSACTSMQNSNYSVKERLGLHRINLIHFVISTCIHSDYLSICAVLDIHITDITVSHSCPRAAHCPLHACAGANCLHYLDISYLRWRAVRPGSRGPGCCWSNCSSCWISLHLNICAGPWVLVVCKSKQSLVIGYGRRGNHRQKGTN